MKTLVLGLGNELYGDDGVGIHAVRWLKEEAKRSLAPEWEGIDFEECSLSGLGLLDLIVGYDRVILIDTIKRQAPVTGRVHVLEEKDLRAVPGPSPHYVSVPQTIELGRKVGLAMPFRLRIVAIEAKNMSTLGEDLSEEMKRCLPHIVEKVKAVLREEEG